jgi:hypothetical protein
MPGDPPPGELVDRAYHVGAYATAGTAPEPASLPERRGLIRTLGIILIVCGAICALMAVVMVFVMARMLHGEPAMMLTSLVYAVPAANLLVMGIGSVRISRWARRGTLISAGIWLPLMLFAVAGVVLAPRTFPKGGGEAIMLGVVMVPMLAFMVGLPITLLVAYTRPSVRATFERRQAP